MGKVIDCKKTSEKIRRVLKVSFDEERKERGVPPCLAVIVVGNDPASKIYVRNKIKACEEMGIVTRVIQMSENCTTERLENQVWMLAQANEVHGIIVQLPLPVHINTESVLRCIPPEKDVDCLSPLSVYRIYNGKFALAPCTPQGIIRILNHEGIDVEGKHCVVIGRSNIVGKPLSLLLTQRNATVTLCHSHTKNLAEETKRADILVSAVGKAGFITADMVKEGAVVIDVGINRNAEGKLVGDVTFDQVAEKASYITPVPGGVGVMTVTELLYNTYILYSMSNIKE